MDKKYKVINPPKKVSDWRGLLVRSKCETSTPVAVFKKGTIFLVKVQAFPKLLKRFLANVAELKP